MEQRRVDKGVLIVDMLDHVEQKDDVILFPELLVSVVHVVTDAPALAADRFAERGFVEIETINFNPEQVLALPLQKSVATADLGDFQAPPIAFARQFPQ